MEKASTSGSSPSPERADRGETWVVVQSILFVLVATSPFTGVYWPDAVAGTLAIAGFVVLGAGLMLLALGAVALGRSMTPFPRPSDRGRLVQTGVYGAVRHPVYGAVLLICVGASLIESPLGLVPTAMLVGLFDLKARFEERLMGERYPAYARYRARTPWRFLPGLY